VAVALLTPVSPADLQLHWERIKPGLEVVRAKAAPEWIPEDIYFALKAGTATLLLADECDGFLVVQKQQRAYGACLLIWVAYAPGEREQWGPLIYPDVERVAREVGARRIEMHSPRRGWERDPFWTPKDTVYIHEVTQ
jgi:hypothetical protein